MPIKKRNVQNGKDYFDKQQYRVGGEPALSGM